ncbi:hypothetical protein BY996DRAFT_6509952 [Phakopsora pachyrhizi]|nr:hypothetical protein BY996DRAFT_6509952 [Phakopsora pachyrhizi]
MEHVVTDVDGLAAENGKCFTRGNILGTLRAGECRVASAPKDEGYSTDDSLSLADLSDLLSASQLLISSTSEILRDTSNLVFLSPTNPTLMDEKFQSWKSHYPEDYANAFGNLALVQAWEFWV